MKHESINSIGVIFGILLGAVGIYLQMAPKKIDLKFEAPELVRSDDLVELNYPSSRSRGLNLFGPIFWKITITNNSERPASIIGAQAFLKTKETGKLGMTGIFGGFYDQNTTPVNIHVTIPALESEAYFIRGYLPVKLNQKAAGQCLNQKLPVTPFMQCMIRQGYDIFGNELDVVSSENGSFVGAAWPMDQENPQLLVVFQSNDNKEFEVVASFLPTGW